MTIQSLPPHRLYQACDTKRFSFETTADLDTSLLPTEGIGQPRAAEAIRFGTKIRVPGYNIYALGPSGTSRHTLIRQIVQDWAKDRSPPSDYCYVYNFQDEGRPGHLRFPPGWAHPFAKDMDSLVEEAQNALKTAFESEEYQNRKQAIEQELKEQQQKTFETLQEKAREKGLTLLRTPSGIAFAPVKDGEVVSPDEFHKLEDEERKRTERDIQDLQQESQRLFQKIPSWQREAREKLRELDREVTGNTISQLMDELRQKYADVPDVQEYLNEVEQDIVANVATLLNPQGQQSAMQTQQVEGSEDSPLLRKYKVNVLVDNSGAERAPVIYEDNPTFANLTGKMEYAPQMGALITDFTLIKPGALHRANGGVLLLDARHVLMNPGAWDGLKRALKSGEIKIESLAEMYSLLSTVSLEPRAIELDVKVVLVGPPMIYYLLREMEPDFAKLFKVAADFDTEMDWSGDNQKLYANMIAGIARQEGLLPLGRRAVGRLIEHASRLVEDKEKLTTHMQSISDLIKESDFWAREDSAESILSQHVQQAIDSQTYRSDRIRERLQEEIHRGTLLIDTEGEKAGQINGLSVMKLGDFAFGRPNRITARVRLGGGEVLNIEREVELSGPIHSKGVLILSSFLGSRYTLDKPLSLSASLVFEQSYGGIEGDSASSAELFSLISAISRVPLKQSLAVTGSVNQHGEIQAIGGVNEKIEGFFDVCLQAGLSGDQGVIIPEANVSHLMLRQDVIEAVEAGSFHIYPIQTVDQGLELLTGMSAGEADANNVFPGDTVNGMVQKHLTKMAEQKRSFSSGQSDTGEQQGKE